MIAPSNCFLFVDFINRDIKVDEAEEGGNGPREECFRCLSIIVIILWEHFRTSISPCIIQFTSCKDQIFGGQVQVFV